MTRHTFRPLTLDLWKDFEKLFGPKGACAGCWCMFWLLPRKEFTQNQGAGNKRRMKRLLRSGTAPGLIAYDGKEPVGWCALAPRETYSGLERSRILARVDKRSVWSIVCFFVTKNQRRKGVTVMLLRAAVKYVKKNGGKILEGYPVDKSSPQPAAFMYTGLASAFRKAGFKEVLRRSETRPIMRYFI